MEPSPANCDEINVLSHDGCQLVAVVLGPGITKCARQSTHGLFITLGLCVSDRAVAQQGEY
jgi:hypothetical protein